MKLINYVRLGLLGLSTLSQAQSNVTGLGDYTIGVTTPDSLSRIDFREEEPSYVKGTIALPCDHIRTFTSPNVMMAGVPVANVLLVFYDNRLAKISGDYSPALQAAFVKQHGPGVRKPVSHIRRCATEKDKTLLVWGDIWRSDEIMAFAAYQKGYTTDCQPVEKSRLMIASRRMTALSSDCDVKPTDSLAEEFLNAQTNK